jgi:hypothetical protein
MRKDGGRIVCIPEMAAAYIPRNSLRRLGRQYWRYGFSRVRTSLAHPESMRPSHVLPPGLALTTLAALAPVRALRVPARLGLGVYAAALAGTTVSTARRAPLRDAAWLPAILGTMHLSAGFGFLWACLRLGAPLGAVRAALGSLLRR